MNEKWSNKYKQSIDCDNPKGFSQRAHCQGKKKSFKEMREYVRGFGTYPGDTMKPMSSMGGSQFFPNRRYATTMPALSATYNGPGHGTYKPMLSASKKSDELEHMKLIGKAMKTMPQSPKQKQIKKQINVIRQRLGLKPIKEEK